MSMYGYDVSYYDYGFSDSAITGSIYGNSISPMAAGVDYDGELYIRRRPPPRQSLPIKTHSIPPNHRHDGTSPLPLGMDWSFAPLIWEGRNSVWPLDLHNGWSFCVTIPSLSSDLSSDTVFYGVKIGIQSPEGITTIRTVPRRFSDFLNLYSELKKEFPKKKLPPPPPKSLLKTRSKKVLVDRICALECWMTKLLSDIDVSRTAPVAIFLELEASAREAWYELHQNDSADVDKVKKVVTTKMEIEDIEELQRTCIELDLRLTIEQDARANEELMKESMIQKNEMLMKEIEVLRREKDDVALKYKSDVLEGKSVSNLSEDKLMVDTCVSLSDTIDVLETSDTQIGLLLEKARVGGEDVANEDDELRKLLGDILIENGKLRKQVNSVISHAVSKTGK